MGRYHAARTQRVDLLDRISEKSRNQEPPNRMGLFQPQGWKATALLLARLRPPLKMSAAELASYPDT